MKKRRKEPDCESSGLELLGGLYFLISAICFILGLMDANHSNFWKTGCDRPMTKIEYVFPAYHFGCWMNRE